MISDRDISVLKILYGEFQARLRVGQAIELDPGIDRYRGLIPQAKTCMTREGTIVFSGDERLEVSGITEYIDSAFNGAESEIQRKAVYGLLSNQMRKLRREY